ncbi:MAG: hypothetical protein MHMPM18_001010 [Marteilia pararefringens]
MLSRPNFVHLYRRSAKFGPRYLSAAAGGNIICQTIASNSPLLHYKECEKYQLSLVEELRAEQRIKARECDTQLAGYILSLTHSHCYTCGAHWTEDKDRHQILEALEHPLYNSKRGGKLVYHGPGQIIIYPILNLECFNGIIDCLTDLINVISGSVCEALSTMFGLRCYLKDFGIWTKLGDHNSEVGREFSKCKLGFIGLARIDNFTYHGLALNYDCDIKKYFKPILTCGAIDHRNIISLKDLLAIRNSKFPRKLLTLDERIRDDLSNRIIFNLQNYLKSNEFII